MGLRLRHVGNKQARTAYAIDPLHKLVLDMALELLLRRWRHRGIPLSSTMSLYRVYERELRLESSFRIWWDMWCLFDGAARVAFLQGVSPWWIRNLHGTCVGCGIAWWRAKHTHWRNWMNQSGCPATGAGRSMLHPLCLALFWISLFCGTSLTATSEPAPLACSPCLVHLIPGCSHCSALSL